jgi:hypothetical protein
VRHGRGSHETGNQMTVLARPSSQILVRTGAAVAEEFTGNDLGLWALILFMTLLFRVS